MSEPIPPDMRVYHEEGLIELGFGFLGGVSEPSKAPTASNCSVTIIRNKNNGDWLISVFLPNGNLVWGEVPADGLGCGVDPDSG